MGPRALLHAKLLHPCQQLIKPTRSQGRAQTKRGGVQPRLTFCTIAIGLRCHRPPSMAYPATQWRCGPPVEHRLGASVPQTQGCSTSDCSVLMQGLHRRSDLELLSQLVCELPVQLRAPQQRISGPGSRKQLPLEEVLQWWQRHDAQALPRRAT
jgi:hypothetical protein